jgi:hypothetical protein
MGPAEVLVLKYLDNNPCPFAGVAVFFGAAAFLLIAYALTQ